MNAMILQLSGVMKMPAATTQWEDTIVPATLAMTEMDLSAGNISQKYGAASKVNFNIACINYTKNHYFMINSTFISVHDLLVQIFLPLHLLIIFVYHLL